MARHRSYSIELKRQVAQEYLCGEGLNGLARCHDFSRNLICVWIAKYEGGAFDDEFQAVDLLQQYEPKIRALERLIGRQALEIEIPEGLRDARRRREARVHPSLPAPWYVRRPRMPADGSATLDLLRRPQPGRGRRRDRRSHAGDL